MDELTLLRMRQKWSRAIPREQVKTGPTWRDGRLPQGFGRLTESCIAKLMIG